MSRRTFLKFCSGMAAVLALPVVVGSRIATALESAKPMRVIWLHGQACGGDTAAFLRAASPTASELLLRLLSVEYHESLMARSGSPLTGALSQDEGYLAVIEGSVPTGADGMYCLVGGRPFTDVAREVADGAVATIAVGSCAVDGGASSARNGVSDAVGVASLNARSPLVNLPGCPVNVENLVATVVHYLTFNELPPMGPGDRPLFAYGGLIHNQCERRAHYEFGEYATEWGDAGAQQGWCLYKLGCKGPETFANCPTKRYAEGTSWAVESGHGCIGCTMPAFWDTMLPAYQRLPGPLPFAPSITADQVGGVLVGGVAGLAGVHAVASYARARLSHAAEEQSPEPADEAADPAPETAEAPEPVVDRSTPEADAADVPPEPADLDEATDELLVQEPLEDVAVDDEAPAPIGEEPAVDDPANDERADA